MQATSESRGALLRRLRDQRGISQTALAHAIGIRTQGTISAWENDKQDIDHDHLLKLAEFFRVDPVMLGYQMPQLVNVDEVRAWLVQEMNAAEERARMRHMETHTMLGDILNAIRAHS